MRSGAWRSGIAGWLIWLDDEFLFLRKLRELDCVLLYLFKEVILKLCSFFNQLSNSYQETEVGEGGVVFLLCSIICL